MLFGEKFPHAFWAPLILDGMRQKAQNNRAKQRSYHNTEQARVEVSGESDNGARNQRASYAADQDTETIIQTRSGTHALGWHQALDQRMLLTGIGTLTKDRRREEKDQPAQAACVRSKEDQYTACKQSSAGQPGPAIYAISQDRQQKHAETT